MKEDRMNKNEKGAALVVVIAVFMVLTILSGTFITVSTFEQKNSIREEKRIKAYYAARSGADAAAQSLINNVNNARNLLNATNPSTVTGSASGGTFSATVTKENDGNITIQSTGTVGGISNATGLKLIKLTSSDIFDRAVFSNSSSLLDLVSVTVTGSVEARGDIHMANGFPESDIHRNSDRYFASPVFPAPKPNPQPLSGDTISASDEYSEISKNNGTLTFNTGGNVLTVVVGTLYLKCDIVINGGGRVLLYVRNSANFQTPDLFNINPSSLIVYLADGITCNIQANGEFNGYIYGPNANITIESSQTHIRGSIIGNVIAHNSNPAITYVPIDNGVDISTTIIGYKRDSWQ